MASDLRIVEALSVTFPCTYPLSTLNDDHSHNQLNRAIETSPEYRAEYEEIEQKTATLDALYEALDDLAQKNEALEEAEHDSKLKLLAASKEQQELLTLREEKLQWTKRCDDQVAELQRLQNDQAQWQNDYAELQRLRQAEAHWQAKLAQYEQSQVDKYGKEKEEEELGSINIADLNLALEKERSSLLRLSGTCEAILQEKTESEIAFETKGEKYETAIAQLIEAITELQDKEGNLDQKCKKLVRQVTDLYREYDQLMDSQKKWRKLAETQARVIDNQRSLPKPAGQDKPFAQGADN